MKKENKIVFVVPIYLPAPLSGSEIVIRDIAETLSQSDNKPIIVTSDVLSGRSWYDPFFPSAHAPSEEYIQGVRVIRLACRSYASLIFFVLNRITKKLFFPFPVLRNLAERIEILSWGPILVDLEKTLVKLKPDVVMLSPFPAGICLTGKEICARLGIPYCVIPFFKKDHTLFENHLLKGILNEASVIFTPTNTEKKYIRRYTQNNQIHMLPSSIDTAYIRGHISKIEKKAKELVAGNGWSGKKIVLFAGNKGSGKGIFDAVAAVEALQNPNVVLLVMGNSSREWTSFIKKHTDGRITDLPYLTGVEKYAYFALCDMLILPSVTDNFPLVFLEAWQFKKPVVAYDFYSMKELLDDGSGFLAKPRDTKDLSRILNLLIQTPSIANKAGLIGYDKVKRYERSHVVGKYFLPLITRAARI